MSELVFGPSFDPLFIGKDDECLQPRLDGGYDLKPRVKAGRFLLNEIIKKPDLNQPSLFDEEIPEKEITTLFE